MSRGPPGGPDAGGVLGRVLGQISGHLLRCKWPVRVVCPVAVTHDAHIQLPTPRQHSRPILIIDYRQLRLPDSEIRILLQLTADPKITKERMHLDIETDNVEMEVRRLEELGAKRWKSPTRTRL